MDSDTLLTWTPANMITVCLMAFLGFAILGAATRIIKERRGA